MDVCSREERAPRSGAKYLEARGKLRVRDGNNETAINERKHHDQSGFERFHSKLWRLIF